jgi:arylsulfatase A-like enzyme
MSTGDLADLENVVVYVADSLRWDAVQSTISDLGPTFKTVAQSLHSPSSFATLLTGRYVGDHGVHSWEHRLPTDQRTLCDLPGYETSFHQADTPYQAAANDPILSVLRRGLGPPLGDLSAPFVYVERDLAPHVPYGDDGTHASADEFFASVGADVEALEGAYEEGVDAATDRFLSLLSTLEDRGLREETLVVCTSDHGELLGEYGNVGHNSPLVPELAYVPTTFVHPSLTADAFSADPAGDVIEHVDVVATVLGLLGEAGWLSPGGVDLSSSERERTGGVTEVRHEKFGHTVYDAAGVFDDDGGYVRTKTGVARRLAYVAALALQSPKRFAMRADLRTSAAPYLAGWRRYGDPDLDPEDARELLENVVDRRAGDGGERNELDDEARQHLRDLGYLN